MAGKLLKIDGLTKGFPIRGGIFGREVARVQAVRGVDISIDRGEVLGLVGESGCGKSTLGMLVLRLIDPDGGTILFDDMDITKMSQSKLRPIRKGMQVVFQDPYASLNPRMSVGDIIGEPLLVHKVCSTKERRERVVELLKVVGLSENAYGRYPHEFSGGQRQRVGIARAIVLTPKFVIADEPVSALDVSIRGEILNLLEDLKDRFSLTYLFISHDLKVVEHISDRIAVMYLGKIMEMFPAKMLGEARHPYTQALVSAIPIPDPGARRERIVLEGDVPSPIDPPSGCSFHPRCSYAKEICKTKEPELNGYGEALSAACHFIDEMKAHSVGNELGEK